MKKNQHYIPRLILESFSSSDEQVAELFIPSKMIYYTNRSNAMTENYTYEHPDIKPNTIEDMFCRFEGYTAPKIKELRDTAKKVDAGTLKITHLKEKAEELYKFFIISYYRSGALLAESSMSKKEDRIPLLTQKISDFRYVDALIDTMKQGYNFALLKSNEDFLLSDQCMSTVAIKV